MNIANILTISQVIISVLMIITILLQQRGGGLSGAFGGESTVYSTRRGVEKVVFRSTIVLAILFITTAVWRLFL